MGTKSIFLLGVISLGILGVIVSGETKKTKVLVLGAGMAGVMSARTLNDAGIDDFIILEGSDRVGGRMRKQDIGDFAVEHGANWIQGTDGVVDEDCDAAGPPDQEGCNPIHYYADKYNLTYVLTDFHSVIVLNESGSDITAYATTLYDKFNELWDKKHSFAEKFKKEGKTDTSEAIGYRLAGWNPDKSIQDLIEYFTVDFEDGVNIQTSSLIHGTFESYYAFGDESLLVIDPDGYAQIPQNLLKEVVPDDDDRLQLNTVVTKVEYNDDGVKVTTENGDIYEAEYVMCTFSLGVLQYKMVEFDPEFPEWKIESTMLNQMATYTKINVQFPEGFTQFWQDKYWLLHQNPRRGYFPIIMNLEKIFPGSRMLQMTLTGEEAIRISRMKDEDILAEINAFLKLMYPDTATDANFIDLTKWFTNPLTKGSYSNWPVGYQESDKEAFGAHVGRVYFAGEATSEKYYGYVHGAYYEGRQRTKNLISCMEDGKCDAYVPATRGCTYKAADNYNKNAKGDDGSCKFSKSSVVLAFHTLVYSLAFFLSVYLF